MKILYQKVNKLEVAAQHGKDRLDATLLQELLLKWPFNSLSYQEVTFSKGSKFQLINTIEDGYMDGRGEKHLLQYIYTKQSTIVHQFDRIYIFRGSLTKAFDLKEK